MGNVVLVLFCLLAAGYVFWETGTYPASGDISMNAGLYPRFLATVLTILALILAVKVVRDRLRDGRFAIKNRPSKKALLLFASMVIYCVLLGVVGYVAATVAFVFAATIMFHGTPRDGILVGVGITALLLALFRFVFHVPLPTGMLNLL